MTSYCLKLTPHYSGLISAQFPDIPGLVVLGRDHQEAKDAAREALAARLAQRQAEGIGMPEPRARGLVMITLAEPAAPAARAEASRP